MSVQTALTTVEEFLQISDPREGHHELHNGAVVVVPPPKYGHHRIQRRLMLMLVKILADKCVAGMEVPFRPLPEHEVWSADVACVSLERDAATGDSDYLVGSPELVVEVLSSNTSEELHNKMLLCMRTGCLSFWIVDQKQKTVSVREGNVTKHYSDAVTCCLFQGEMPIGQMF